MGCRLDFPRKFVAGAAALCLAASGLGGCSLPETSVLTGHANKKELFYAVVRGVQCEIRRAIYEQVYVDPDKARLDWLKDWSALMEFQFTFDTQTSFNPGVSLLTPNLPNAMVWLADGNAKPTAQSYATGIGVGLQGDANRVEHVKFFYPFDKDFFANAERDHAAGPQGRACYRLGGFTIGGELGLREWLDDVLEPIKRCAFIGAPTNEPEAKLLGIDVGAPVGDTGAGCATRDDLQLGYSADNPIKVFSHEVSFKITLSAGATPTWNLVRVATAPATGSNALFSAQRQDIFDLTITLGSADTETVIKMRGKDRLHPVPVRVSAPSREMILRDQALQIGSAVRDALGR